MVRGSRGTALTVAIMLIAVVAVYFPVRSTPGDNTLFGSDYLQLHLRRIRFAQEALFGAHPHLPAWYPRELLGTPFWSNVQNFPFLPTRLVLLIFDPLWIYPIAVNLAAVLAALCTFLYARRIGLSPVSAAAAGWTFACAGFFAARVMAGHLPLLEAYPALPMLLWLVERCHSASREGRSLSLSLLSLGLASGCFALAGHPQLPIYAIGAAAAYTIYRVRGRRAVRIILVMAAGVGSAAFVLLPMWLLVLRSTRVLALNPPTNNIAFPYQRVIAFLFPWHQGWPAIVGRMPHVPVAFPNDAYFWDTVCYVGCLPVLAAVLLLLRALLRRRVPAAPWRFIIVAAIAGLVLAFPAAQTLFSHLPITFLRSPSRLLYFTEFGLAMALGAAGDMVLDWDIAHRYRSVLAVLALIGAFHFLDLGLHDRCFVRMVAVNLVPSAADEQIIRSVGDGRVAIDRVLWTPINREIDDIGYFDSIALAKPYAAILDLADMPPQVNTEFLDGSDLGPRALAACGVRLVMTNKPPPGFPTLDGDRPVRTYPIVGSSARAAFFPLASVQLLNSSQIHRKLRDPHFDTRTCLMLPRADYTATIPHSVLPSPGPTSVNLIRNSEDAITIGVTTHQAGFIRVLEAWDRGWKAWVDGQPVRVTRGDDMFLAVAVPSGSHTVRLVFSTPGAWAGSFISAAGLVILLLGAFLPSPLSHAPLRRAVSGPGPMHRRRQSIS